MKAKYMITLKFCFKLLGISTLMLTLSSCSDDFLELDPESNTTDASFFKTAAQMEQAVIGAYVPLRDLTTLEYWLFGEMRSDNTTFQYYNADRGLENRDLVDYFLIPASAVDPLETFWQKSYTGIARANTVLDYIDGISDLEEQQKKEYKGEVRFLRAFYYYHLVQQFGGIPLELVSTTNPSDAHSEGRASKEEIFNSIIEDLTIAVENLPTVGHANRGRATSGAAKTMLAKAYMAQGSYSEAVNVLQEITEYSLLSGDSDSYRKIFDPNYSDNSEIIFSVQYLGSEEGLGSTFLYQFAPNNSGNLVTGDPQMPTLAAGSGWNHPTRDMIQAYEEGDLRKEASLSLGFMDENGVFVEQPYVSKYNFGFDLSGNTSVNFPTLRYADVLLMLAESLNEEGFSADGEAFDLVNQVRNRAGLEDINSTEVTNQDEFREAVFQERRVELAFENHRWYDLLRRDNIVEIMNTHGEEEKEIRGDIVPSGAYEIDDNSLLLPIPQREVTLNNLEQNPQ
ncbi:Starch-binding associating with outer membrane [Salegentibacter agarivorans]|uniref:Starch-binding associating with outer membrane n=1 Tax=Salegentibacter agarivorans TaxID=345907 RepID=A0A1I2MJP9_9FLAO|nr:RagB/SusD family nutrient uptake outer membrane protein [Salegentibacter agarivorans]SFF89576.1 Starch-binding associating with outer membrane [Salegentibacter agarivorans]